MAAYRRKQAIMVKGLKKNSDGKLMMRSCLIQLSIYGFRFREKYESSFKFCEDLLEKSGIVVVPGDAFGEYGKGFLAYHMYAVMKNCRK